MGQLMETTTSRVHSVWDAPTRWFHWINVGLFVTLLGTGLLIQFMKELHIEGGPAKIALKKLHVVPGYLACANLLARLLWGFWGNAFVRWRAVLPSRESLRQAIPELRSLVGDRQRLADPGHGHLGRVSTTWLLGLLCVLAVTGLARAATDLYFPPFGSLVARYVALPGVDPAQVGPLGAQALVDPGRIARIAELKAWFGYPHRWGAYVLTASVLAHVIGVVLKDIRHGGGVLSSMVTGRKVFLEHKEGATKGRTQA